jgi:hypothetical protein
VEGDRGRGGGGGGDGPGYEWPRTHEVFVADGYVNRRVIVLDAASRNS